MTDTPAVPTAPAENDVKIWEHCDPPWSLVVIGWDVSAGRDCPMKPLQDRRGGVQGRLRDSTGQANDVPRHDARVGGRGLLGLDWGRPEALHV